VHQNQHNKGPKEKLHVMGSQAKEIEEKLGQHCGKGWLHTKQSIFWCHRGSFYGVPLSLV
jgi:hypothetical protein